MKDLTQSFETLKERQQAEADKLAAQAGKAALKALSPATVTAAAVAVDRVTEDRGRGGLGEPAADLADVRSDPAFAGSLLRDLRTTENEARLYISGALSLGYRSQVEGTKLNGAKLVYTEDAATRAAMAAYPILGETAAEHAKAIAEALRRDVLRAVGLPLTGQADAALVAESLGQVVDQHAKRVEAGVSEGYFAGVQAGFIDASKALVY